MQLLVNQSSKNSVGRRFPGGENMNLLFISNIANLLLKTKWKEAKGLILLFLQFGVL